MPLRRRRSRHTLLRLLSAGLLLLNQAAAGETASTAVPGPPLARGSLLIAHPQLSDPRFRETVIVITDKNPRGTAGLIINRPSRINAAHALPELKELAAHPGPLFAGGPVGRREVFVLLRSEHPPAPALFANIFFGQGLPGLRAGLAAAGPADALRIYAGYAGWSAGQLEGEISRGDWLLAPADGEAIFDRPPQGLWRELIERWSGRWL